MKQQSPQIPEYKTPFHFTYIQQLLTSVLKDAAQKYQSIILTQRTSHVVFSMISQSQLLSFGYKKIILSEKINPYMQYDQVVLVLSLAGEEDFQEVSHFSHKIDKVYIVNLSITTQQSKGKLKKLQFQSKNAVRGYKQQNLDFQCYLQNVFVLNTRRTNNPKQKKQKKKSLVTQDTAIDRLCSFLCSYENFSQFEFYLPKNRPSFAKSIQSILDSKLSVLIKYNYKGFDKNQGMSATKTRVIVLERTQKLSPFIMSLLYGPLVQEINVGQSCRFVSAHSIIYNTIYHMDLLSASNQLSAFVKDLSDNKEKQINGVDFLQTKKVLQKAYNQNFTKQELSFHQALIGSINKFLQSNCQLLVLQQSIANKINDQGQEMKGSKIVEDIFNWCSEKGNQGKYEEYLGLVLQALTVHSFWWFQRNQLIAGISDKDDLQTVKRYSKNTIKHNLKQIAPKIQNGEQIRQRCFRHYPTITVQLKKIETEIKEKKVETCEVVKVSKNQASLAKKTRTIIYINDTIGYNELAMLAACNRDGYEFVCRDVVSTRQWTADTLQHT